jgi:hypothetical protein
MTIKIGFPDIPKRAVKFTSTDTWGDTIKRNDLINNISGPRYSLASLQSNKTGLVRVNYDLGETTSTVDHCVIGNADLLRADDVKSVRVRGSRQSAFVPSSISGLKLWLDATQGVTTVSGAVSQWDDLTGLGNHATQGTAGNRPLLSRYDNRENRHLQSETLGSWSLVAASVTANTIANPISGSMTADKIVDTAANAQHYLDGSTVAGSASSGESIVFSGYFKAAELNFIIFERVGSAFTGSRYSWVRLSDGVVTSSVGVAPSVESIGGGWYRITMTETATASGTAYIRITITNASGVVNYLGTGAQGVSGYGMQVRAASTDSTYIATTTTPERAGINSNRALVFTGTYPTTSNYLNIASNIIGVNTAQTIFAVARKDSGSSGGIISGDISGGDTCVSLRLQTSTTIRFIASGGFLYFINGTINSSLKTYSCKTTGSGGTATFYIDGISQGTTTPANNVSVGNTVIGGDRNFPISNTWNGYICEILVYDSALSDPDRQAVEQYLTDKWTLAPTIATHTLGTDTLANNDLAIIPSATSSAYRHWWLEMESDVASKFAHSKIYFGLWLDMGEVIENLRVLKGSDYSSLTKLDSGAVKLSRGVAPKYLIEITWAGLTDAKVKSFIDSVASQINISNSFYLYSGSNTDQLNGESLLYCKLIEWGYPEKNKLNYNTITAVFEELT